MKLPEELRERLASEYRQAARRMNGTTNPTEKLYYYSVLSGEAMRVLNWKWDRELALIWFATQQSQQAISARVQALGQGDRVVQLTEEFFQALTRCADNLAEYVGSNAAKLELLDILGELAELTYITTGNGYYLLLKGEINLGSSPT